ncbi:GntR family transcriptional regulator [Leucobacter denitrificans]|uniref:GntR family transcriptional regulator n=1 Tax=Leucobacter denitrificans TaxID=683042 RepID=A0A7G9S310_9MICO|nr:GntR family transcriptional regulator [Leucobacter denitrificans]QNN62235.1 GntR family transcriptional regulator [Leucobacter denitrificans]
MNELDSDGGVNQSTSFERPLSKTEYVLQRLRQELVDGTIQPGTQIRQGDISARYGVSATPVREALRRLEAEGHVSYSPHRGATVNTMPEEDLYALYRFRIEVEKLLASLAVERADADAIALAKQKHADLKDAAKSGQSAERLSQLNREFHLAVMRAGAPYIADRVVRPLWKTVIPTSQSQWDRDDSVKEFLHAHDEIMLALEGGDAEKAGELMGKHVLEAYKERLARIRKD